MKQKIEDLSEQDYKEFFEWLLEKKVIMDKELDLSLCIFSN